MKILISILFLTYISACTTNSMKSDNIEIERLVIMALDSHKKGNLNDALMFYDQAIIKINEVSFLSKKNKVSKPWINLKAQVLYESGLDKTLIEFTDHNIEKKLAIKWWCHILERRGKLLDAEKCWTVYGDPERMLRTVRSREVLKAFTPPETQFGYVSE